MKSSNKIIENSYHIHNNSSKDSSKARLIGGKKVINPITVSAKINPSSSNLTDD